MYTIKKDFKYKWINAREELPNSSDENNIYLIWDGEEFGIRNFSWNECYGFCDQILPSFYWIEGDSYHHWHLRDKEFEKYNNLQDKPFWWMFLGKREWRKSKNIKVVDVLSDGDIRITSGSTKEVDE